MSTIIGYTFILVSDDTSENSFRYVEGRIIVYRNLSNIFRAINKLFKDRVLYTVNIQEFIQDYSDHDFKPTKVGYVDDEAIIVKCLYSGD